MTLSSREPRRFLLSKFLLREPDVATPVPTPTLCNAVSPSLQNVRSLLERLDIDESGMDLTLRFECCFREPCSGPRHLRARLLPPRRVSRLSTNPTETPPCRRMTELGPGGSCLPPGFRLSVGPRLCNTTLSIVYGQMGSTLMGPLQK